MWNNLCGGLLEAVQGEGRADLGVTAACLELTMHYAHVTQGRCFGKQEAQWTPRGWSKGEKDLAVAPPLLRGETHALEQSGQYIGAISTLE